MQSHETAARGCCRGTSAKHVAAETGAFPLSMIYKWAEPPDESSGKWRRQSPRPHRGPCHRATNDNPALIQWLLPARRRFSSSRIPRRIIRIRNFLIPATNEIVQEFADLLAVIATAAADNHINKKESADHPRGALGGTQDRHRRVRALLRAGQLRRRCKRSEHRRKPR